MTRENEYPYKQFDDKIKASQKLIWFSFGIIVGVAISMVLTGFLLYIVD